MPTIRKRKAFFLDFVPKIVSVIQEGYSKKNFLSDLIAGTSVGIISIPLAMAFAISSGLSPETGLFTAIVAGFLISLFGGSRFQIGGPTGAFVVIVYGIVQRHGYDGLAVATLMASAILIVLGIFRLGSLLRYVPYPVVVGFSSGIAVVLFSTQIKDFFGLSIGAVPPEFLEKWSLYGHNCGTFHTAALMIGLLTLILNVGIKRRWPRMPAVLIALVCSTSLVFLLHLPVETIAMRFGSIPRGLPHPALPHLSIETMKLLLPDALTIAFLGGIESLLSAAIADGLTGRRHRCSAELLAQGIGNCGSVFFGGMPATGAIARTTANVHFGAKSPIAGMIHALTILVLMLLCAPLVNVIPLACLAAVLIVVAWNMSEHRHFVEILKGPRDEAAVLLLTFLLTVFADLTVAILGGVILAALLFIRRMRQSVSIEQSAIHKQKGKGELLFQNELPEQVSVYEMKGPLFFGVVDLLDEALKEIEKRPKVLILLLNLPLIDSTGERALKQLWIKCQKEGMLLLVSGIPEKMAKRINDPQSTTAGSIKNSLFSTLESALRFAEKYLSEKKQVVHH